LTTTAKRARYGESLPPGVADRGAQIWVLYELLPRGRQAEPTLGRAMSGRTTES
jgi:hypothetical protein